MTLTVKLAEHEKTRLRAIAEAMNAVNQSEVIRALINEKFDSMQAEKTLVERRGGHPLYLLDGTGNLSDRKVRKSKISEHLESKSSRRST